MSRDYKPEDLEKAGDFDARETFSEIRDRATEFTSKVKDKAGQVGGAVSEAADRQRKAAAGELDRLASAIHNKAGAAAPVGPAAERAAHRLAEGVESTASYLRDHEVKDIGGDLMGVCRRHPGTAVLSALAVGFLVGVVVRRK